MKQTICSMLNNIHNQSRYSQNQVQLRINNKMSIIQEFLQQNLTPQISPSLQMELDNISASFNAMTEQIQSSRNQLSKDEVLNKQKIQATTILANIKEFSHSLKNHELGLNLQQLMQIINPNGNSEWVVHFLKSKKKVIMKSLATMLRQAIEQSKSNISPSHLQRYITQLQNIHSLFNSGKEIHQSTIEEADSTKLLFTQQFNVLEIKNILLKSINRLVLSIRQSIYKLDTHFDRELDREMAKQKSPDSPLKILKQQPSSRAQTPIQSSRDKPSKDHYHQMSKSKIIIDQHIQHPFTLAKPRFDYFSHLY